MGHEIANFYPEALWALAALFAVPTQPPWKARAEKSLNEPGNPDSYAYTVLLVSSRQSPRLLQFLKEIAAKIFFVSGVQEAQQQLSGFAFYDLLLVDAELPDGSWRELLPFVSDSQRPRELIVCSRLGDERLWVEAMALGAFDLIVEPYEEREVLRIIQGALDSQLLRRFARRKAA